MYSDKIYGRRLSEGEEYETRAYRLSSASVCCTATLSKVYHCISYETEFQINITDLTVLFLPNKCYVSWQC
jgi:hypothetical protein